jgi:hypothetical protein
MFEVKDIKETALVKIQLLKECHSTIMSNYYFVMTTLPV